MSANKKSELMYDKTKSKISSFYNNYNFNKLTTNYDSALNFKWSF